VSRDDGAFLDSSIWSRRVAKGRICWFHFSEARSRTRRRWQGFACHVL